MSKSVIESCVHKMGNQFELVIVAAHRVRQLNAGSSSPVVTAKSALVALKELADNQTPPDLLMDEVVQSYRSHRILDAEEDNMDQLFSDTKNVVEDSTDNQEHDNKDPSVETETQEAATANDVNKDENIATSQPLSSEKNS